MIKLANLITEVSQSQLNQVEKYLDKLWDKVGIDVEFTRHFMDRVNDARNNKPINTAELIKIYREVYKKYGKQISQLSRGTEIVLRDMDTDINVPVVLQWDGKELDMVAKTVMRKKNFMTRTKKYSV
tara:strand:- start:1040 stop:1420 length:381 start_codon:yes stop_codon:yes gene_type:complete